MPVFETAHYGQTGNIAIDCRAMKTIRGCFVVAAGALLAGWLPAHANPSAHTFRTGAFAMDVTPTNFPVIVNGGFLAVKADHANDSLHARWLVLDDGATRVALGVLDTCLIPREFADEVKARATKLTGIPPERIMLSAVHTHSAPSLMQALGTPPDPNYPAFALPRIVEGLRRAVGNLAPARVGWAVAQAPEHTHTRVWIRRPDRMLTDPFGDVTVRAMMHPGYQSPDVVGPVGPSDPALTLLAAQSPDGRRIRYYTPMDGPRSYWKGDTYCCPNNYRRIIAELPGFVCYRVGGGVVVNLYTTSEAKVELSPQLCVKVRQETDYPNSGRVAIRLEPSRPAPFPLRLRIPRWCEEPKVSVNGEEIAKAVEPGEFFVINRKWQSGDRVELELPMPVRLVAGRVAQAGRVAIMRGPQVFCLNRSRYPNLANADLRLLVMDPKSVEGPFPDNSVRPGGVACRVKAWGAGAWYPGGKPSVALELSEFADPAGEFTYFKVPNPNAEEVEDDELLAQE